MKALDILALVVGIAGFGMLIAGIAMISIPGALITAGACLLAWSYLAATAAART